MEGHPLHAGLAHLPVGIAFLLPLLGLGVSVAIVRAWLPRSAWLIVVLSCLVCLATAHFARQSGDALSEARPTTAAVTQHQQAASLFFTALAATTVLSGLVLAIRRERLFQATILLLSIALFGVMLMGLEAARQGEELVYRSPVH